MSENVEMGPTLRRLEFAGVTALAVTVFCVVLGQGAERYALNATLDVAQAAKPKPQFNAIDYATTGSTGSGLVVIGPCDTHRP